MKKYLYIDAQQTKNQSFNITIQGENFDPKSLSKLFDFLEGLQDQGIFITFPFIPEIEEPELVARIKERMKTLNVESSISFQNFKDKFVKRVL